MISDWTPTSWRQPEQQLISEAVWWSVMGLKDFWRSYKVLIVMVPNQVAQTERRRYEARELAAEELAVGGRRRLRHRPPGHLADAERHAERRAL
ncbi:hypothetical protein PFLUV_G00001170 [Perca fluviatilis]|uniref:Uncharacterized protein n=1 Tax=Perca fluviatilis TaxID=8168 RepID=A0A6A5FIP0_PERFL|nr:hypothetical protein PFLUV_G00001170 [Perca fluviatilis]